jgi:hypothetical protein
MISVLMSLAILVVAQIMGAFLVFVAFMLLRNLE